MKQYRLKQFCFILVFGIILVSWRCFSQDLIQLPMITHISSTVSDGKYSLFEIVKIAKENGIKVVIITDRDLMRWEYGIWPLRKIIKKRVERNSIFKYGIKRYLKEIENLQKKFPEMIIIPGTESAPFYYWEGSIWRRNLKMHNWHKHILTAGLEKPEDYEKLPIIGNFDGLKDKFQAIKLWPFLTLLIGLFCIKKRIYGYKDYQNREFAFASKKWKIVGTFIIFFSFLSILNNWPFFSVKFDSYHGDLRGKPYQYFIDYVNKKGGLTFWAHPEAENISIIGRVRVETRKHPEELLRTKGYTGFAIFYEGYKIIGKPGGIWDEILKEYCQGKREKPIWAIGGLAFDNKRDLSRALKKIKNIILVPEIRKDAVLEGLRKGRVYVVKSNKGSDFYLKEFCLLDELIQKKAIVGEEIEVVGKPYLYIKGDSPEKQKLELKIIKGGKVIKTYKTETPFEIVYQDKNFSSKKNYYRIEIRGRDLHFITNPIFCIKKTK
jgi:hypothetical protein